MIIPQILTPFSELPPDWRYVVLFAAYKAMQAADHLLAIDGWLGRRNSPATTLACLESDAVETYICGVPI